MRIISPTKSGFENRDTDSSIYILSEAEKHDVALAAETLRIFIFARHYEMFRGISIIASSLSCNTTPAQVLRCRISVTNFASYFL